MINCSRIFLTVSQNPTLCMQWDICYCNSSAVMKMVHEFEAKGCRGRLRYLWLTYRNVLERKTLSMFHLFSWAVFPLICIDMSVKNTCNFTFLSAWGAGGSRGRCVWVFSFLISWFPPERSLTSYVGRNRNVVKSCFPFLMLLCIPKDY